MHSTPGANLTYLASPRQFFMSAKSFTGTLEMQQNFFPKDKLKRTMKKCTVFMETVNVILEDEGIHTKLILSPLLLILDY